MVGPFLVRFWSQKWIQKCMKNKTRNSNKNMIGQKQKKVKKGRQNEVPNSYENCSFWRTLCLSDF